MGQWEKLSKRLVAATVKAFGPLKDGDGQLGVKFFPNGNVQVMVKCNSLFVKNFKSEKDALDGCEDIVEMTESLGANPHVN